MAIQAFPTAEVSRAIRLSEERSRSDVMPMNHALATNFSQDMKYKGVRVKLNFPVGMHI